MLEKKPKHKILVLVPASTGHLNPMCGIVHELCKEEQNEVIFFTDEKYKQTVEKTGARCKIFSTELMLDQFLVEGQRFSITFILRILIDYSSALLPQLIDEIVEEKPDLIIYDSFFMPAKYLLEVLKNRTFDKQPKTLMFSPQFVINDRMLQSLRENTNESYWSMFTSILPILKDQLLMNWTFGVSIYNPLKLFLSQNDHLNLVGVLPELQPFVEEFNDGTFKFLGSCISDEVRCLETATSKIDDKQLESFLEPSSNFMLIYMSLGTVFNMNSSIFETVIEAIKRFDDSSNRHFKSDQFRVVFSLGEISFSKFSEKISNGELAVGENFLIRSRVPQLEVLKRADLYITHCGMNSTNEAIRFSVPIIGIPLEADQPSVAKRVCDELKFGVRLDPLNLDVNEIGNAIDLVLSDSRFKENISNMSRKSAKSNGSVEGAKIISEFLEN